MLSQKGPAPDVVFWDLYCGIGGATCGAVNFSDDFFADKRVVHIGVDCAQHTIAQCASNVKQAGHTFETMYMRID